jgi:hypothetical protein
MILLLITLNMQISLCSLFWKDEIILCW